jgi:hypothetical protein
MDPDPLTIHSGKAAEPLEVAAPPGSYPTYYAALRDAIAAGGEPPVPAVQACAVMSVIEAGGRSVAEGRVVTPDLTPVERRAWSEFESKNRSAAASVGR